MKNRSIENFILEYQNRAVAELVNGRFSEGLARIENEHILKSGNSVYMFPESNQGRAGFFSTLKRFNNNYIETSRFNLTAIWMLNLILYVLLLSDFFRLFFNLFRRHKLEKY